MSEIKRLIPRLKSMVFRMKFQEIVQDLKPVWVMHCTIIRIYTFTLSVC